MAKIKLSSIGITNISGKAGGSVYSRNRGGSYMKNFTMPTNTITDARQLVRAVFGAISSHWRNLTQEQRNSWIEQAPNYLRLDVFSDQRQLQPNALHQAQNTNLVNAGLPQIATIGAPEGTNAVISSENDSSFVGTNFQFTLNAEESNAGLGNEYVLEAAPPHSQSVKNVQNKYRKLAATTDPVGTTPATASISSTDFFGSDPADAGDAYVAMFGQPKPGDVVSYRVKAVNPRTGETSAYFYVQDIWAAS